MPGVGLRFLTDHPSFISWSSQALHGVRYPPNRSEYQLHAVQQRELTVNGASSRTPIIPTTSASADASAPEADLAQATHLHFTHPTRPTLHLTAGTAPVGTASAVSTGLHPHRYPHSIHLQRQTGRPPLHLLRLAEPRCRDPGVQCLGDEAERGAGRLPARCTSSRL
jgi:hypothetical protein